MYMYYGTQNSLVDAKRVLRSGILSESESEKFSSLEVEYYKNNKEEKHSPRKTRPNPKPRSYPPLH